MISDKKRNEILAFVWVFVAVSLFVCLISYRPDDIPFQISTPNDPVQNFVGPVGAYIAWALRFAIGYGSYFLVALFLFWALAQWTERKSQSPWLKVLSGSLFFISSCSMLAIASGSDASRQFNFGGIVGFFTGYLFQQMFGNWAIFIASGLFMLSLLLATDFMFVPLILMSVKKSRELMAANLGDGSGASLKRAEDKNKAKAQKIQDKNAVKGPLSALGKLPLKSDNAKKDAAKNPDAKIQPEPVKPIIRTTVQPTPKKPEPKKEPASAASAQSQDAGEQGVYILPSMDLMEDPKHAAASGDVNALIEEQSRILQDTLADFGIEAKVVEVEQGPVITRYEIQPASGVRLSKITALQDNIAAAMQATSVRILAPIPGKSRVGIEVPNADKQVVSLKDVLRSDAMVNHPSKLAFVIGKDSAGAPLIADLDDLPHLLIAGSTGSGKSVCVNSLIMSLLYRTTPEEVRMILVDPKRVELTNYNGLPNLLLPVVTETEKAPAALSYLISEMDRRYKVLQQFGVRDVESYNAKLVDNPPAPGPNGEAPPKSFPYIVTIVDELADLMTTQRKEVETSIQRLAQLARAVGIHLVLATQRPSVDVITGVIKANFPSRISFSVTSGIDSRTVLDEVGAETLLGKGDLLYMNPRESHLKRGQGAWVSAKEIDKTVNYIVKMRKAQYDPNILISASKKDGQTKNFRDDEYYPEACRTIVSSNQASVSTLQRRLGLGYTRAARLVDMMEEDGIVGPSKGAKPRDILITIDELEERIKQLTAPDAANQGTPS
ncbi:MAG: DNA translocase FtsK [Candidatus Omnitrophica bacterium]|nr:DNA translocase FtsK [Candidatus Omnitrophota bacterium]